MQFFQDGTIVLITYQTGVEEKWALSGSGFGREVIPLSMGKCNTV